MTRRKREINGLAHFTFRVDTWTPDGESIVEHVAGVEDYQVALATYRAACERWPGTPITLRQGARVIEDSRRLRMASWSDKGRARAGFRKSRGPGSVGETPQPAATGAHSMAGMGHCRSGATSNSNSLAPLHSGLEQEARGGP
jgi:hypothetical protein